MFRRSVNLLVCIVLVGIPAPLHADDQPTNREIRVAAIDLIPGHDTLRLRTGPGTKPIHVPLNIRTFSQPIRYKGPATAVFFRDEAEASLEEPPAPIATAVLADKSSLIIFSPRVDGSGYQTMVIADSGFPFGSFYFVNRSGISAMVEIDGRMLVMKHGAADTITFRDARNSLPVRILTATKEGSPRLVRQSSWSINLSQRELIFIMPGSAQGQITLRHFIDSKTE